MNHLIMKFIQLSFHIRRSEDENFNHNMHLLVLTIMHVHSRNPSCNQVHKIYDVASLFSLHSWLSSKATFVELENPTDSQSCSGKDNNLVTASWRRIFPKTQSINVFAKLISWNNFPLHIHFIYSQSKFLNDWFRK